MNGEEFREEEIKRLAKAFLKECLVFNDNDYIEGYECQYCYGNYDDCIQTEKEFIHDLDCPALIAKDILV